jgi:hypothetical protein
VVETSLHPRRLLVLGHHDLDGMVSAAVTAAFLRDRFPGATMQCGTVDFHLKAKWARFWEGLGTEQGAWRPGEGHPRPDGVAIVDFLYAEVPRDVFLFHADHHRNTFDVPGVSAEHLRASFAARQRTGSPVFHDPQAGSCAALLLDVLSEVYGWAPAPNLAEAVRVAHIVDSAQYASAREALDFDTLPPALDLLSLNLSEPAAGRAVERLAAGATLEEALIRPNRARYEHLLGRARADVRAYDCLARVSDAGVGTWDFTQAGREGAARVKFAEYRDARVQYAMQLHVQELGDGSFLAQGLIGRSPWPAPLPPGLVPPDVSKIAQHVAGGGGQPFAAGWRLASGSRDAAVAQARAQMAAMGQYLRPLAPDHPMADTTHVDKHVRVQAQAAAVIPTRPAA